MRLPSESEWEYACRAGTTTPFAFGATITPQQVNYDGNHPYGGASKGSYRQTSTNVGSFPANAFGLFDMHGNVYEWCQDLYNKQLSSVPQDGTPTLAGSGERVFRGGFWPYEAWRCRSAARSGELPDLRSRGIGVRPARSWH
ncbi:MAG: formylglycine-generating enzyme family protein [Planctomycetes bacterium]|nr:formylglycine-generating enzyme family protein [Planctomycetota bacterium]